MSVDRRRPDTPASSEGGTSYLTSAADLMMGLLFVFIIMVAFMALQKNKEREARAGDRDPRGAVTLAIGQEIRKVLPSVKVDPANGVITLPEDLLFDIGSSDIKDSAVERLSEASSTLSVVLRCFVANQMPAEPCTNNPYRHQIDTIFIEGHTDNRSMNRVGGNIKLSLDRAISVNAVLVDNTALSRFRNRDDQPIFSYSAYADTRPLIRSDPSDGRNRRVDLRILLTYRAPDAGIPLTPATSISTKR